MNCTIENTNTTPYINFRNGNIYVKGKSIPTENINYLNSFINLIQIYSEEPEDLTVLSFDLEYINSHSRRCILQSFKILEKLNKRGYRININWYYNKNDEYMLDLGVIFSSLVDLRIILIEK